MTQDEIYGQLTDLFRAQFKDPDLHVVAEMTANDVAGWDSLAHIRLILGVEKSFGVKFRTAEISAFRNVGDLAALIASKLASQ